MDQIKRLGRRLGTASKTLTGTFEQVLWSGTRAQYGREAVMLKNQSDTLSVYGYLSKADEVSTDLVSITSADRLFEIEPSGYIVLHVCEDIEILLCNSSGDTTTSLIAGVEVGL